MICKNMLVFHVIPNVLKRPASLHLLESKWIHITLYLQAGSMHRRPRELAGGNAIFENTPVNDVWKPTWQVNRIKGKSRYFSWLTPRINSDWPRSKLPVKFVKQAVIQWILMLTNCRRLGCHYDCSNCECVLCTNASQRVSFPLSLILLFCQPDVANVTIWR